MKRKKIGKGQPLNELVKGSLTYTMERIRTAFRSQFRNVDRYWNWYICEIFADHVIVCDDQLPPDEFYKVAYTQEGESYLFAAQDAWEVVELTYQSKTANERRRELAQKGGQIPLIERLDSTKIELLEAEAGKPRRITARGMTANIINNNNRRYTAAVLTEAVKEASALAAERRLLAESVHPSDKLAGQADILESLVRWDAIAFEGDQVLLEGEIIPTKGKGENLIIIMEHGVFPRLSQRANGKAQIVEEHGRRFVDITELHITGYDLVMDPGDPTADTLVFENRTPHITPHKESIPMDEVTLEALRAQHPELVAQIIAEHNAERRRQLEETLQLEQQKEEQEHKIIAAREAALRQELGLGETDDLKEAMARAQAELKRLQEAEQARQVAEYIEKEVGQIKYADLLKKQFAEAVKSAAPKTVDEAKQIIIAKRREYDALQSGLELAARGHGGSGVTILGSVLERDRGVPEFARAAFALNESMVRQSGQAPRDLRAPRSVNERFAAEYLERFDRAYRHHLLAEARAFEEAEQTSDLNLPYSVVRAVMAEALPELVAVSIFDVQMADPAPTTNVWFESYAAETGATLAVTDEAVTAVLNGWASLANKRLVPGTVVLTNAAASVTYAEGTDYVIDYAGGRLKALATITNGQSLLIDYTSDQIRKGEMASIERMKNTLTSKPLTMVADRLATQISREAVIFSRSTLGYDATNRTLMRLVKQIQRKIDSGLFYLALASVLSVSSNSGGTWTAATDSLDALVAKLGTAKVKVANRFYDPTFVLLSKTNSDRLSNWASFTAAGARPDADLNAAGYVGRVKGIPVFDTANFQDGFILVGNRELVAHRVGQPIQLKGPFPSYSSDGELIGAEQYYAEEFNGSESFVPEKGASVKVA